MIDDQFTPDERALIERLASAPQPNLKSAALDAIRQRMFDALDAPPAPPVPPTSTPLGGIIPIIVVVVVIVAVIVGAIAFINNAQSDSPSASPVPVTTSVPVQTAVPSVTPAPEITAESTASILQPETTLEPLDTAIVIEGPVESVNVNVITIYGIKIELAPDDPLLTAIQIGDVIRVEGNPKGGDTVIIVAVHVIFVNVEVVVSDGQVWRDSGNCNNPPPPWAPAHGWRRRCESGGAGGGGRGGEGSGSKD